MKRRILFALTFFLAVLSRAAITPGENQMWWGYFDESLAGNLPYSGHLGYSLSCTVDAAIFIPASESIVSGGTIKAIRLWLGDDISGISSSLRVWISTTRPSGTTIRADLRQNVLKTNLTKRLNEVELSTPFEVKGRDIWVGFTFTLSKKSYPVMAAGNDVENGFYYRIDNGTWQNFSGTGYGNLALQVLVEGEDFPTNNVIVPDFGQTMVVKGSRVSMPVTIKNKGMNAVKSISYVVTGEDGSSSEETTKSFSTSPIAYNGSKTFSVIFPAEEEARKFLKTVTVTKVNDEPNTAVQPSGTGFVINLAEKKAVTPVIEEFTGTWCGWCPRGTVGMERVHETYGDRVVQIAAHTGDPMAISDYQPVINTFADGFPGSITDRQFRADPSFSELKSTLTKAWNRVSQGTIELSAEWENAEKSAVCFNTKTSFSYSEGDGQYAIAYILTEDGMTGTGSSWAQQNNYSGQSGDSSMQFWYRGGSSVTGVKYNHVPVAAWEAMSGVDGTVSPKIERDVEQEYTFLGSIEKNTLIQDKEQMKAVVLLIDRVSGTVVNAAQSVIREKGTAINAVSSESEQPAARYSVDGRKLSGAEKGINIVRMNDGTVKKVLVK